MRLLGAAITAVVTIVSFGQAWAAAGTAKSLAKMLLVGVISDIVATGAFAASDAMGMPPALSAVLALVVGIATGKVATDLLFPGGVVDPKQISKILDDYADDVVRIADKNSMTADDLAMLLIKDPAKLTMQESAIIDELLATIQFKHSSIHLIESTTEVNFSFALEGDLPPYKPGTITAIVEVESGQEFVRVFTEGATSQAGGWVMLADDIAGLTPLQIQEKFALPNLPTHVTDVIIEPGTQMRTGICNSLFGFEGGGQQYQLLEYLGKECWQHVRPL